MTDEQGHNGWKNYETWVMALWIDNEQWSHAYRHTLTDDAVELAAEDHQYWTVEEYRRFALADALKVWQEECMEEFEGDQPASVFTDLLHAAFSEVDWVEIADSYLSELAEESAQ